MKETLPLTPDPSPTQAGRGEKHAAMFAPLPEFGEGLGVGWIQSQQLAIWMVVALLGLIVLTALPVMAQEATQPVTFDQINAIARHLYCPVCPNETLEACQTQACAQWRDEIGNQLAEGQTEQQIIDSFVRRYGDRVLGTPQDPALRALSLVTPFLIAGLGLLVGVFTFMRWRRRPRFEPASVGDAPAISDDYRNQLERDLKE